MPIFDFALARSARDRMGKPLLDPLALRGADMLSMAAPTAAAKESRWTGGGVVSRVICPHRLGLNYLIGMSEFAADRDR